MKRVREVLFLLLLAGVVLNVVLSAIRPLIPIAFVGLVLVWIFGMIFYRKTRW